MIKTNYNRYKRHIKQGYETLITIPEEYRTFAMCKIAATHDNFEMSHLPKEFQTSEYLEKIAFLIIDNAYNPYGNQKPIRVLDMFRELSEEVKTFDLCRRFMSRCIRLLEDDYTNPDDEKNYPTCISLVPAKIKSQNFYEVIVEDNEKLLKVIPEECQTLQMCENIIKKGGSLNLIPKRFKSEIDIKNCYLQYLNSEESIYISNIPSEYISYEEYLKLVKIKQYNIEYVPNNFKTFEMCIAACELKDLELSNYLYPESLYYLKYIPINILTEDFYLKINCRLYLVPEEFRSYNLCSHRMKNRDILEYVPEEHLSLEMCQLATKELNFYQNSNLKSVPETFRTYDFCFNSAANNTSLKYVPEEHRNIEMCLKHFFKGADTSFYSGEWDNYTFVPKDIKTKDFNIKIVSLNPNYISQIPDSERSFEVCCKVVEQDGSLLMKVPKQHRTLEMCKLAYKNTKSDILKNIPEKLRQLFVR